MKKVMTVFSMVLLFLFTTSAEGQILKKLTKKIQDKVLSKTVEKNTLSNKDVNNSINGNLMGMIYGKNKVDVSTIPDLYLFSWEYTLEMQSDTDKKMVVDYFLEPNSEYFGFKMKDTDGMFLVIDSKNKLMINTFNQEKSKMAIASKIPDYAEMTEEDNEFTYKPLPNKVIMGFNCKGIQATSTDFEMVFYYTNDAKVSFSDLFKAQQKKSAPSALQNYFKAGDKPLMMTMTMKDLKNKGTVTTMKCIGLVKKPNEFKKLDYKFM